MMEGVCACCISAVSASLGEKSTHILVHQARYNLLNFSFCFGSPLQLVTHVIHCTPQSYWSVEPLLDDVS